MSKREPVAVLGYDAGYAQGWVERGNTQNAEDCYIPIPLPWRLVKVGDTLRSPDGRRWTVEQIGPNAHRRVGVQARCGGDVMRAGLPFDRPDDPGLDPDAQVQVLEEAPLAQAEAVLREQFTAARILARTDERSTP